MGQGYERTHTTITSVCVKFVLHYIMLCGRVKGKGINTKCVYTLLTPARSSKKRPVNSEK